MGIRLAKLPVKFLLQVFLIVTVSQLPAQKPVESTEELRPHLVEAGDHDYAPGHGFSLNRRVIGFDFAFSLPETAWFDPSDDGPLGNDGKDWNKAGGISYLSLWRPATYPKNRSAALVGIRPAPEPGIFEVCAYTNAADGSWETGNMLAFSAGDTVFVSARIVKGKVSYRITTPLASETTEHRLEPLTYAVPVGPWFGGNRESPIGHRIFTRLVMVEE